MPKSEHRSNTILVALDGSQSAQAAANAAIHIARAQKRTIQGLYVVDEALVLGMYADYRAELGYVGEPSSRVELLARFEEQGSAALRWLEARCRAAGVPVTTNLLFGGVPELVSQAAAQVDLLALGRRGRGHATDPNHLGRNFRAIAHHAHRPILVGGDEQQRSMQRLLLVYSHDERAQHALSWASSLQHALSAEVLVLAVRKEADTPPQWLSEMPARLDRSELTGYRLLRREGEPASEIVAAAAEHRVDLIIMGGYHHPALLEWLAGSTQDHVLRRTRLPVLIA